MPPLAPSTLNRIEYISLFDAAVDRAAMSTEEVQQYAESMDRALLKLKADLIPVVWLLRPLDDVDLAYCRSASPPPLGDRLSDVFWYVVCQVGVTGVTGLPAHIPPPLFRASGLLRLLDSNWVRKVPVAMAADVASRILQLSRSDEETEKNWSWLSGAGT